MVHLDMTVPQYLRDNIKLDELVETLTLDCVPIVATQEEQLSLTDLVVARKDSIVGFTKDATITDNKLRILIQPTGLYGHLLASKHVSIKWSLTDRKSKYKSLRYLIMERVRIQ